MAHTGGEGYEDPAWSDLPHEVKALVRKLLTGQNEAGESKPLVVISARFDGEFDLRAGVDGEPSIPATSRIVAVTAEARDDSAAKVTIGGVDVSIRPGGTFRLVPEGRLMGSAVAFQNTRQYVVQLVTMPEDRSTDG